MAAVLEPRTGPDPGQARAIVEATEGPRREGTGPSMNPVHHSAVVTRIGEPPDAIQNSMNLEAAEGFSLLTVFARFETSRRSRRLAHGRAVRRQLVDTTEA